MRCDDAAVVLTALSDGAEVEPGEATQHVQRCLRCQAELAQHRKIRRTMAQLRRHLVDPGPDLLAEILVRIDEAGHRQSRSVLGRHRAAYVAAAATAATAAGAAGALVLVSRSRRPRLSPTG